jgi:predicted Zn-dependent protease
MTADERDRKLSELERRVDELWKLIPEAQKKLEDDRKAQAEGLYLLGRLREAMLLAIRLDDEGKPGVGKVLREALGLPERTKKGVK